MNNVHNCYFLGFIVFSALLNVFIENESIGIKTLCTTLLFTTFVFASLSHSLQIKLSKQTESNTE